jgi:selenocysteine lyase/cysteine desulfurase
MFLKKYFPALTTNYFNTAYFGPMPELARLSVEEEVKKLSSPNFISSKWLTRANQSRECFQKLIHASSSNSIFHQTSSSDIVSHIAYSHLFYRASLSPNTSFKVCAVNGDYPSNILPWMRLSEVLALSQNSSMKKSHLMENWINSFSFECLSPPPIHQPCIDANWAKKTIPKDCQIFIVSWVSFSHGLPINLPSLGSWCKEQGVSLILDVTQGLGPREFKAEYLEYLSALTCSSYKWLLGPYGHAFGYIAPQWEIETPYLFGNWLKSKNLSQVHSLTQYSTETHSGSLSHDRGQSPNLLQCSHLEASLNLLTQELSPQIISQHTYMLWNYFLEKWFHSTKIKAIEKWLPSTYKKNHNDISECFSGIITLEIPEKLSATKIELFFKNHNVHLSIREGRIRISLYFFNQTEEIDFLLDEIFPLFIENLEDF